MSDVVKLLTALLHFLSSIAKGGILTITQRVHQVYELMNRVVDREELGIHRMLILRIHNGGGNLSSSRTTYASVVYEECRPPLKTIVERYQSVPSDKYYMHLLQDIRLYGSALVITRDMPESTLRDIFTVQGVVACKFYFIKEKKCGFLWRSSSEMHICSIATADSSVSLEDVRVKEELNQVVSDIRRKL